MCLPDTLFLLCRLYYQDSKQKKFIWIVVDKCCNPLTYRLLMLGLLVWFCGTGFKPSIYFSVLFLLLLPCCSNVCMIYFLQYPTEQLEKQSYVCITITLGFTCSSCMISQLKWPRFHVYDLLNVVMIHVYQLHKPAIFWPFDKFIIFACFLCNLLHYTNIFYLIMMFLAFNFLRHFCSLLNACVQFPTHQFELHWMNCLFKFLAESSQWFQWQPELGTGSPLWV